MFREQTGKRLARGGTRQWPAVFGQGNGQIEDSKQTLLPAPLVDNVESTFTGCGYCVVVAAVSGNEFTVK